MLVDGAAETFGFRFPHQGRDRRAARFPHWVPLVDPSPAEAMGVPRRVYLGEDVEQVHEQLQRFGTVEDRKEGDPNMQPCGFTSA